MKKTNKKVFTLVELLAVIVILGVLLMIAVPAIQNVIRNSRKKSFESAAKLALENVETMASAERTGNTLAECYIPIGSIELERGSFGKNAVGVIIVNSDGKAKIGMYNDEYVVSDCKLENKNDGTSGVQATVKQANSPITITDYTITYSNENYSVKKSNTDVPSCTWYTAK